MFYKVPIIDGVLDIDYTDMKRGITIDSTAAIIETNEDFKPKDSWLSSSEDEFLSYINEKEHKLRELKAMYLGLITEADLLGDTEEKTRLQQEYLQKKAEIEAE